MSRGNSLTDSSTSESEEDGKRSQNCLSMAARIPRKRGFSIDDTEDENADFFQPPKVSKDEFKIPSKYIERDISDSEIDEKTTNAGKADDSFNNTVDKDKLSSNYGLGMKLMEKMGYKPGTGLGRFEQGRTEIIETSKQRGRRGLGLILPGLEPSQSVWDSSKDEVSVREPVEWMPKCKSDPIDISTLRSWIREGKKKIDISNETQFCDPEVLKNVLAFKSVFNDLEPEEMRQARTRSNPFEIIRGGIFLNRAAMKMANMDAMFDFMFTEPKTMNGEPAVGEDELLYFADVCAGPGGFSEYVLWRKKWESKGFGFTLKGPNDFKLEEFFAGPPETFEPYYGVTEDGDIYRPENLRDFKKFVLANTEDKGVHFVMADGGFSVEGQENEQEILSKRLYLCQFLCALSILRPGGHFVCKLFDLFTPFSVGLVYLMYHAFEKVCIFKPNTSRPANSERYIICKWLKEDTKDICDYMYEVNCILDKFSKSDQDVIEVVPTDVLKSDADFYDYMYTSNNVLGAHQIIHLDKIRVFAKNTELHDERQSDLRKECLALWKVPDEVRKAPKRPEAKEKVKELAKGENINHFKSEPVHLKEDTLKNLKSVFEYSCVVTGESSTEKATLFLGLGRTYVYKFDTKTNTWNKIDCSLELPVDTLFFGELVSELKGTGSAQKKINCLHIVDAMCLGGIDVRKKHLSIRLKLANKLAKAVSKSSKPDYTPLRVKTLFKLKDIDKVFNNLAWRKLKNSRNPKICFDLGDDKHILPRGLLIFRIVKDPWVVAYSKSSQKTYIFNTKKNVSSYEFLDEASADFLTSLTSRIFWEWSPDVKLFPDKNVLGNNSIVHGQTLVDFVHKSLSQLMQIKT